VPESSTFPRVNLIQSGHQTHAINLLHCISLNPSDFFELETIEVEMEVEVPSDMAEQVAKVNRKRERAISLVPARELRDLYGMVKAQSVSFASSCSSGPITDALPVWPRYAMLP